MRQEGSRGLYIRSMDFAYLATRHVGERLGLSPSRVVQLSNAGRLPALRDSVGHRLFVPEMVERFAREREQQATEVSHA